MVCGGRSIQAVLANVHFYGPRSQEPDTTASGAALANLAGRNVDRRHLNDPDWTTDFTTERLNLRQIGMLPRAVDGDNLS